VQLQTGDETALEELVSRYHAKIFSYIYRMSKNHHTSNDITQDVFIKVCRNIKKYSTCYSFKTWIYTIAANTYKDYLKSSYVQKTVMGLSVREDTLLDENTPEDYLQKQDDREMVAEALGCLSDGCREVIVLRFYEELKLEEIATVLHIPVGTVKSRLFNGLRSLKSLFKEGGEEVGQA